MTRVADEIVTLPGGPDDPPVAVRLRRSAAARRLSARIDPASGVVLVTVPLRASRARALSFIGHHAAWARAHLACLPNQLRLVEGALVPLDDRPHVLRRDPSRRGGAWLEEGAIVVAGEPEFVARRAIEFLRAEARRRLGALAEAIAASHGLRPGPIAIRDTRSRWGSCSQSGRLMFNWRLVMAPPSVQHYVVAHELAHLRHMDHGPAFWTAVASMTPDVTGAEHWLRQRGAALLRVG